MNTSETSREKTEPFSPAHNGTNALDRGRTWNPSTRGRLVGFLSFVILLIAVFIKPLFHLVVYAVDSDLYSYILLVPFISAYLVYIQRERMPRTYSSSPAPALIFLMAGLAAAAAGLYLRATPPSLSHNDYLALMTLSFVCFLAMGGFLCLGGNWMAAAAFPFAFLILMVPLPERAVGYLETASKLASAEAANLFFNMTGIPVLRDGTVFQLPGIVIEVVQECSGIRSSWVLLITSLLASHLFLKSPWRRAVLVGFVIPLGILRNGFRILVIGLLCVHVGPHMINSIIHRRGGPLFFALSLVPLFLLLWWLRRGESPSRVVCGSQTTE
jgi:exosortase C (VPDSG-CTERM-specific)